MTCFSLLLCSPGLGYPYSGLGKIQFHRLPHFLSSQEKQQKSQCAKKGFSVPSAPIYPLRPPCYWTRTHIWVLMKVGALLRGRDPCLQGVCLSVPWNQLSSLAISSPSALFTSGEVPQAKTGAISYLPGCQKLAQPASLLPHWTTH